MTKNNRLPFNGDYYDSTGNVRNLLDAGPPSGRTPKDRMSPFGGNFYASDGSVHNLDELGDGGGITEAPKDGREYARKDGDWTEVGSGIPKGCILMWSGTVATIPSGWALCNGTNGTPDLRNRFIVGAGNTYTPGNTGGLDSIALTVAQMPVHNHGIKRVYTAGTKFNAISATSLPSSLNSDATQAMSDVATPSGSSTTHENRPPYYALAYIMKI